jgi:hypothetical protein
MVRIAPTEKLATDFGDSANIFDDQRAPAVLACFVKAA